MTSAAVCKGLKFYRGKTVVFIAPTKAGSAYDVESRAFAQKMGDYLGATINVEDRDSGQSIPGQNAIATSTPNGLTIGFYNTASDLYDIVSKSPGVSFNLQKAVLLGGLPNTIPVLATQSDSPYTSFSVFKKDAATASAPPKVLITSGAAAMQVFLLMREFGITVNYVSGYSNSSDLVTGFIRGDGPIIGTGVAEVAPYIAAGKVLPLALETSSETAPGAISKLNGLSKVPTVGQLLKEFPPKTADEKDAITYANAMENAPNFVLGAPSGTPGDVAATLDAAVKYAATSKFVHSQVTAVGNIPGYVSPQTAHNDLVSGLHLASQIATFLSK